MRSCRVAVVLAPIAVLIAGCITPQSPQEARVGAPPAAFSLHVDAEHEVGDGARVPVHHWCRVETDLTQCVLLDGDENGRVVGVEHILPKDVVAAFPMEERRLWHDHAIEIPAANATLPDTPRDEAAEVVAALEGTAGKVVYAWDFTAERWPVGEPFAQVPAEEEAFAGNATAT